MKISTSILLSLPILAAPVAGFLELEECLAACAEGEDALLEICADFALVGQEEIAAPCYGLAVVLDTPGGQQECMNLCYWALGD